MRLPPTLCGLLFTLGTLAGQGPTLALLGAPAPGAAPATDAFVRPIDHTWPSTLDRLGGFHRAMPARLTGHTVPDVVVLDGLEPVLMTAPGFHTHVGKLLNESIEEVNDIAVLRGRGLDDGSHPALDALALATDDGLRIWRRNPADGVVTITEVPGTGWESVRQLATHPADPLVIFGIDDNGVITVAEHANAGYVTQGATFPVLENPIAIACVDWDGDNSTELAVVTKTGLTILDRQGNTIAQESQGATSATLTLVRGGTNLDEECLAWLTPAASGGTELRLRSSSNFLDVPLYRTFVAAAATDWSGDGNEDVVLSTADNNEVTVLVNLSNAQPIVLYNPATAFQVAIAASANRQANCCPVATADFDADGDGDLVAFIDPPLSGGTTELRLVQSRLYDSPPLVTPVFAEFVDLGHDNATVTLTYTPGPGGSHTRLVVWTEDNGVLDSMFDYRDLRANTQGHRFVIPIDMAHIGNGGNYVMMVQPVNVVNGNVVEVGKAWLATMKVEHGGGSPGTQVGGTNPLPIIPPPPPEDPPTPGG